MDIKTYKFSMDWDEALINTMISRYHFDENDTELIKSTGIFLSELINVSASICYEKEQVVCAVTLGTCYDEMEGLVEKSGNLLLSYCLECFGMEFLSVAYKKMNEEVFRETGKWMGTYRFLDVGNIEMNQSVADVLAKSGILWEKGMFHPLKSAIFTAEYNEDKPENGCHGCEECENLGCSFRNQMLQIQ